jgi:putative ABC transport system ATP-binding protein
MKTVVRVENLAKAFRTPTGKVKALDDIGFTLDAGQLAVVQGASGCGKTTLLLAVGGLLEPDSGRVFVHGTEIHSLSTEARARFRADHIGFVFQQFHLVPYLSVRENVLAARLGRVAEPAADGTDRLLARFGLERRARHLPAELSTGERQRTALARALLNRPKLLLADEPTGNLDPENAENVWDCLQGFANEGGSVLVVTHDPAPARKCGRLLRLDQGKLTSCA